MISNDTLLLYYYRDGLSEQDCREVCAALERNAALASRYRALVSDLDKLHCAAPAAASPAAVARWRHALDHAIESAAPARSPRLPLWLAAAAAGVVLGIAIGMQFGVQRAGQPDVARMDGDVPALPVNADRPSDAARSAALTRGLANFMQQSRLQLAGLETADAATREALIAQIIEQHRTFERAAMASGQTDLARVLRAFEPLLSVLGQADVPGGEIAVGADQLSFELNVMLTKLSLQTSNDPYSL